MIKLNQGEIKNMKNLNGKSNNNCLNDHGITLVALIITIIILIILAAVTINTLTHDDLADLAVKSIQNYQREQTNEMEMLNKIDNIVKETLKNMENGIVTPKPDEDDKPVAPDFTEIIELVTNNIGKTVDYTPNGKDYSTTQEIDGIQVEYSGVSNQIFQTSDITGIWSLWGVDDENIYIISENTTKSKKLTLVGARGYNNGVTILDQICDTCFTNKVMYPNMNGQNLKLEQILDVTTSAATNANTIYGEAPRSYKFKYPHIWDQYEKSESESIKNKSIAYPLTENDTLDSNISYTPYSTVWYFETSWNTASYWKNSEYHKMVILPAYDTSYWLSSRSVNPRDGIRLQFGLQFMTLDGPGCSYDLYYYISGSDRAEANSYAVRPLVSIPLSSCTLTQNKDGTFHIAPRS